MKCKVLTQVRVRLADDRRPGWCWSFKCWILNAGLKPWKFLSLPTPRIRREGKLPRSVGWGCVVWRMLDDWRRLEVTKGRWPMLSFQPEALVLSRSGEIFVIEGWLWRAKLVTTRSIVTRWAPGQFGSMYRSFGRLGMTPYGYWIIELLVLVSTLCVETCKLWFHSCLVYESQFESRS